MISKSVVPYIRMFGIGFKGGIAKGFEVNYRTFHIALILILCLGVYTTGVAQSCLCEENRKSCKSRGLQYKTTAPEGSICNRCCRAAGRVPCDLEKIADMAGSSTGNHRDRGSDPTTDPIVIVAYHLFDSRTLACYARVLCESAMSRSSVIYLHNQSFLL